GLQFFDLSLLPHIEAVEFTGSGTFKVYGNAAANRLVGGAGADFLFGDAGADTLIGGLGDDVYHVDHRDDVIVEQEGGGSDTVGVGLASGTYVLGAYLERAQLFSSDPRV